MSQYHSHDPAPVESRHTVIERDSSSGASMGILFGALLAILVVGVILWVAFAGRGLPTGGGQRATPTINSEREQPGSGIPNINIPRQIDINVNQGNGGGSGGGAEAPAPPVPPAPSGQ